MGREGNRQAYPCRTLVDGEAPVARRTTGNATRPVVEGAAAPRHQPPGRGAGAAEPGRPRAERRALEERREKMGRGAEGAGHGPVRTGLGWKSQDRGNQTKVDC